MAVPRSVPRLAGFAPYALAAGFFVLVSDTIGDQGRSSLTISWPAGSGSEHAGDPLKSLAMAGANRAGAHQLVAATPIPAESLDFAVVPIEIDRSGKADRIVPAGQAAIAAAPGRTQTSAAAQRNVWPALVPAAAAYAAYHPLRTVALAADPDPAPPSAQEAEAEIAAAAAEPGIEPPEVDGPFGTASLYFGSTYLNAAPGNVEPWAIGEAPVIVAPVGPSTAVAALPDAAAESQPEEQRRPAIIPVPPARQRVVPAALLGLEGRARARAERCLANAVYFEARSEPVRGQIAVAQVVLNRAFSGYYPEDVCGVVYQGANRHLSCQFTFACDGIPDVVTEPEPWQRAQRIAKAALDGKLWLADVGKATHYHASYVNPYWVRSMRRLRRIGLHTFYRPRRWGDGAEAPAWGSPTHAEIAANL